MHGLKPGDYVYWLITFDPGPKTNRGNWNMSELFLDYFKKRWEMEKEKLHVPENEIDENKNFIHALSLAKDKCVELFIGMK